MTKSLSRCPGAWIVTAHHSHPILLCNFPITDWLTIELGDVGAWRGASQFGVIERRTLAFWLRSSVYVSSTFLLIAQALLLSLFLSHRRKRNESALDAQFVIQDSRDRAYIPRVASLPFCESALCPHSPLVPSHQLPVPSPFHRMQKKKKKKTLVSWCKNSAIPSPAQSQQWLLA